MAEVFVVVAVVMVLGYTQRQSEVTSGSELRNRCARLVGPYGMLRMEPGSARSKAIALPSVL